MDISCPQILKMLHMFFLIAWIGSMLCMPFLLLFTQERTALRKLYLRYQLPALLLTVIFGIALFIILPKHLKAGWFHMKMTGVIGLIITDSCMRFELHRSIYRRKRWIVLQVSTILFLFTILGAVYGLRDKQAEWVKAQQESENLYHAE